MQDRPPSCKIQLHKQNELSLLPVGNHVDHTSLPLFVLSCTRKESRSLCVVVHVLVGEMSLLGSCIKQLLIIIKTEYIKL